MRKLGGARESSEFFVVTVRKLKETFLGDFDGVRKIDTFAGLDDLGGVGQGFDDLVAGFD